MTQLTGVNVAMCTPFTEGEQKLDQGKFRGHIDRLIDAGVHGIVLASGTGEFAYMSDAEVQEVIELGVDHIGGRVNVIAQTSAVSLDICIEKSKAAVDAGVDALMVLPPWLEGPFAPGVINHYLTLAGAVDTTYVIYNIPQVSGVEVTPEMLATLSEHPNIRHMKDSTGDLARMQTLIATADGVMGGCDPVAPFAAIAGVAGWIWGGANIMPAEAVALWNHIQAGELVEAMALWETMRPVNSFVWENSHEADYITSVKTAVAMRFEDLGPSRRPQLPLTPAAHAELGEAVARLR